MGSVKYLDYNGKTILFLDYEGAVTEEDVLELSDKATMLVKLGSRKKLFLLYNLTDLEFTKKLLINIQRMFSNADHVDRRVIFGLDKKFAPVMEKAIQLLRLDRNTKFAKDYTDAVNTLTEDAGWAPERRQVDIPVVPDKRQPTKEYTEEDFLDLGEGAGRIVHLPDFSDLDDK